MTDQRSQPQSPYIQTFSEIKLNQDKTWAREPNTLIHSLHQPPPPLARHRDCNRVILMVLSQVMIYENYMRKIKHHNTMEQSWAKLAKRSSHLEGRTRK